MARLQFIDLIPPTLVNPDNIKQFIPICKATDFIQDMEPEIERSASVSRELIAQIAIYEAILKEWKIALNNKLWTYSSCYNRPMHHRILMFRKKEIQIDLTLWLFLLMQVYIMCIL